MLGWTVRDRISGFTGIVTGYVQYITGCNQALVCPKVKEDGSFVAPQWIDEQRLERLGAATLALDNGDTPGADLAPPIR